MCYLFFFFLLLYNLFFFFFFFFNGTATTEIYTLSLHDALPISSAPRCRIGLLPRAHARAARAGACRAGASGQRVGDAPDPDEQNVCPDEGDQHDGDEYEVPEQHLAEVHRVPEGADPDGVEGVLGGGGYPLGVEVLLREVASECLDDGGEECDHAGYPGQDPAPAPGRHPELAP